MRSRGNNFNYFPENQLTKFSAVHPLPLPIKILDLQELHKWSLAFRGEQLLHLLHISYATANTTTTTTQGWEVLRHVLVSRWSRGAFLVSWLSIKP